MTYCNFLILKCSIDYRSLFCSYFVVFSIFCHNTKLLLCQLFNHQFIMVFISNFCLFNYYFVIFSALVLISVCFQQCSLVVFLVALLSLFLFVYYHVSIVPPMVELWRTENNELDLDLIADRKRKEKNTHVGNLGDDMNSHHSVRLFDHIHKLS